MGWSAGTFTQTDGTYSGDGICAAQAGDGDAKIRATEMDALLEDHAAGINACINKDGSNAFTGDIDAGSNKVTDMAEGTASGDAGRWDEDIASLSLDGTSLEVNLNDGQTLTIDLASIGSSGEVTLTGTQTISGKKTFTTNPTILSHLKPAGAITNGAQSQASASAVTCNFNTFSKFHVTNNQAMTLTIGLSDTSDADLGATWAKDGWIMFSNGASAGAVTVACPNADVLEVVGSNTTTNGELNTLAVNIVNVSGTVRVQATWVTPA